MDFVFSLRPHLGQLFSPTAFDLTLNYSFVTIFANVLNMPLMVLAQAYIVEKANKCLDFIATIFFYHLLATCFTFKFPTSLQWWLTHALLVTCTVLISEYVCLKLETAEIKLSVGNILEKGKEIGIKGAQKIIHSEVV